MDIDLSPLYTLAYARDLIIFDKNGWPVVEVPNTFRGLHASLLDRANDVALQARHGSAPWLYHRGGAFYVYTEAIRDTDDMADVMAVLTATSSVWPVLDEDIYRRIEHDDIDEWIATYVLSLVNHASVADWQRARVIFDEIGGFHDGEDIDFDDFDRETGAKMIAARLNHPAGTGRTN